MSIEPELHATSDAMLANLDRLRDLELEKRQLPIGSPRMIELANEIERLAGTVLGTTDVQADLVRLAGTLAEQGDLTDQVSIESFEAARDVHAVLADWREAERLLSEAFPDTPEALRLRARIEVLRAEYRRAHDAAARRTGQPD